MRKIVWMLLVALCVNILLTNPGIGKTFDGYGGSGRTDPYSSMRENFQRATKEAHEYFEKSNMKNREVGPVDLVAPRPSTVIPTQQQNEKPSSSSSSRSSSSSSSSGSRSRSRDNDARERDYVREQCTLVVGEWTVDRIKGVYPTFHSQAINNVVAGLPMNGYFTVRTEYVEKQESYHDCKVIRNGIVVNTYTKNWNTKTREMSTTDFQNIRINNTDTDLTVFNINEQTGEFVLQWKDRQQEYRLYVDVTLFNGETRKNVLVPVYNWPSGKTTSAIKVEAARDTLK